MPELRDEGAGRRLCAGRATVELPNETKKRFCGLRTVRVPRSERHKNSFLLRRRSPALASFRARLVAVPTVNSAMLHGRGSALGSDNGFTDDAPAGALRLGEHGFTYPRRKAAPSVEQSAIALPSTLAAVVLAARSVGSFAGVG